jgi:hypothetical protein
MEAANERSAQLAVKLGKVARMGFDALENDVDLFEEIPAEAGPLCLVPIPRFFEIRLGFRAKNDCHGLEGFSSGALNLALTSFHGWAAWGSVS